MVRKADDELRLIARHLRPGARNSSARSSLFRWLHERADAFQRLLDDSQPSWKSVSDALVLLDLRDGAGKPPTPVRIRRTWFEVRRAKGWLAKTPTSDVPVPQKPAETRLHVSATPIPDRTPSQSKVLAPIRASPGRPSWSPEPLPLIPQDEDDPLAAIRREMNQRSGRKP